MKDLSLNSNKFAENQLKKYGWKQGEGIGKTSQGIADPIKASFKFDNTGVGFNISEEFTVNWWEHLYNNTASKIDTNKSTNIIDKSSERTHKKENSSNAILNRKDYFYSRFTKGSLLINGETKTVVENKEKIEEKTTNNGIILNEIRKGKLVSDEELFKVCEGRTAHKGARHGIKMNGKLARIEEQERILSEQISKKMSQVKNNKMINDQSEENYMKKRKSQDSNIDLVNDQKQNEEDHKIKKKKNKKKKSSQNEFE